jgi:SAM-dependent methyltransferase
MDPVMSQGKVDNYRSTRGAAAYHEDHQAKLHRRYSDRRERRILSKLLASARKSGRLLDCPSGFGRFLGFLLDYAERVVEADFSPSMLELNRELHGDQAEDYVECSALELPMEDRAFDTVVSIRLNHHIDSEELRLAHIRELCRVSDDLVVFTYFSKHSLKNRLRQFRGSLPAEASEERAQRPGRAPRACRMWLRADRIAAAVAHRLRPRLRQRTAHEFRRLRSPSAAGGEPQTKRSPSPEQGVF